LQESILEDTDYQREGRITAFLDSARMSGLTPGSSVKGVILQPENTDLRYYIYDRRLLIPILLPGFAGIPFFRGRDTTEFLEQYNKLYNRYRLVEKQKAVKLL
jgi:hypothetical protein